MAAKAFLGNTLPPRAAISDEARDVIYSYASGPLISATPPQEENVLSVICRDQGVYNHAPNPFTWPSCHQCAVFLSRDETCPRLINPHKIFIQTECEKIPTTQRCLAQVNSRRNGIL